MTIPLPTFLEPSPLLAEMRRESPRRFARWDGELFDAAIFGPASLLADALEAQPDRDAALHAYYRLIQQAIGTGLMRRLEASDGGWSSFLERCLAELVPAFLPAVKPGKRVPLLVKLWNLGEGLSREPGWLDRYVTARSSELSNLTQLEEFLVRVLDPVLAPAPPAAWRGPFAVSILDFRPVHDEFLPGEVTLAGPTLIRVADRRIQGLEAAVLLRGGGQSEILGMTSGLGEYAESERSPTIEFYDGKATVGGQVVEIPFLRDCHRHAVARVGFIAASAVDSQRLWILESP